MSTTDNPANPADPTSGPQPGPSGPRIDGDQARDLGRLRRTLRGSPEGRPLAGVAGGLARHLDIDPVIVRVLLVVLVFFGGAGLILYAAGWLLIPEEGTERAVVQLDDRTRSLALYAAAALALLALLGDTVGRFDFPWPIAILAVVALILLTRRDRLRPPPERWQDVPPAGGTTAGAGTAGWSAAPTVGSPAGPALATPGWAPAPEAPPAWQAAPTPPGYVPPTTARPVLRPDPRRRGPVLFWFTLALIALLEGVLGLVDAAGVDVAGPAYAALAVGVTGLMLVLGAFWGRAGGLILVGLVATLALGASVMTEQVADNSRRVRETPTSAAAVRDSYVIGMGELRLDLTGVSDAAALDGREIDLEGDVGRLVLVLPDAWGAHVESHVGVGHTRLFDHDWGGLDQSGSAGVSAQEGAPTVDVEADLGIGSIEIVRESERSAR